MYNWLLSDNRVTKAIILVTGHGRNRQLLLATKQRNRSPYPCIEINSTLVLFYWDHLGSLVLTDLFQTGWPDTNVGYQVLKGVMTGITQNESDEREIFMYNNMK